MAKQVLQIGIDLGTANTLVYISKKGIVYNEPSVVAYDKRTKKCIACGFEAKRMLGKTHDKIRVVKPLEGGVVADLDATKVMMEYILMQLKKENIDWARSTLLMCCPSEITVVERAALLKLAKDLGIGDAFIEQEVKAGAIGAGCDIYNTIGVMVVDLGGGSADVGVLSCGDLVVWDSVRVAGSYFDASIQKYVKQKYNLLIGDRTAEKIKLELGTLAPIDPSQEKVMVASGRHLSQGQPASATIRQSEVRELMVEAFERIKHVILATLEKTPPEISADIIKTGLVFNGGSAMVPGLKEYFEDALGLPCMVSPNCLTSIVEGTKQLLKNRGNYLIKPVE